MAELDLDEKILRRSARDVDPETTARFMELVESRGSDYGVIKFSGIHFYYLERLDEARRYLAEALSYNEDDVEVLLYLMRLHHRRGEMEEARRMAERIAERDPGNVEALRMSARIAHADKDFATALDAWRRLARQAPDDREAPLQITRLAWRLEEHETAVEHARRVLAFAPDNLECLDILVKALHRLARYEELAALLPQYVQVGWEETVRFLEALESAEAIEPLAAAVAALVRLEPPVAEAVEWASKLEFRWLADAVAAELRGDDVAAAALYRAVLTVHPANREASSSMGRLKASVAKALREAQAANDADAIVAAAGRLLTLDPSSTEAEFALGRLHLVAGRPEEALVHLRRAAEGTDSTVWHHLNLGRAAMACQRYEEALAAFRRIVESGADPAHAYVVEAANSIEKLYRNAFSLARRRLAEHEFEESWKLLAVADAAQPGSEETAAVREAVERRMYSAVSAVYKDRPEAARPKVEAFLRLFPDNDRALVMHGRLAMKERDYAAAVGSWLKLAQAMPDDAATHLQIARCHAWLKSAEPAVEAARRALALDPGLDEAKGIIDRFASA